MVLASRYSVPRRACGQGRAVEHEADGYFEIRDLIESWATAVRARDIDGVLTGHTTTW
jgi:hypothetical protein